ncbi:hypothetical protein MTYP_02224 [Methylophilaceae bacterium]|nr:hypothetical protein MTYP_02224 [Methylophilaceae bacterium]
MSSALSSAASLFDPAGSEQQPLGGSALKASGTIADRVVRGLYRDVTEKQPTGVGIRGSFFLGALVVILHIAAVEGYVRLDHTSTLQPVKKSEVVIEFVKPVVIPPPVVEPPKPLPPKPQPKVQRNAPPPPVQALRTPVAEPDVEVTAEDITVVENTEAPPSTGPVTAEPPAPPAPPVVEEPVTEATGYAGYLQNPAPEYPAAAQRQGWEGKVVLRVRVLANGTASSVEIKQSSGRKILDQAAVKAVKGWLFSPSKRGNTPIDGWATVPIEFRLD